MNDAKIEPLNIPIRPSSPPVRAAHSGDWQTILIQRYYDIITVMPCNNNDMYLINSFIFKYGFTVSYNTYIPSRIYTEFACIPESAP